MRPSRPRITYANVVATLALFIALGGVSWAAATLPKNSVGSKQIKKNAVTSAKIKSNSITGAKVKSNSLTGSDINEATLGKVPSAASADTAGKSTTTDSVATFSKRVAVSATGSGSQDSVRSQAAEVPLASSGQVSIYGKCYIVSGAMYAEVLSKTTADGALASTYSYNYYYGQNGYLNTSTPESQRIIYPLSIGTDSAYHLSSPYYGQGTLFGADGNSLSFFFSAWAKNGTIATYGNGAFGAGNVCIFAGNATRNAAG